MDYYNDIHFEEEEDETVFDTVCTRAETFDEWCDRVGDSIQEWLQEVQRGGWCLRTSIESICSFYWRYAEPLVIDKPEIDSSEPYEMKRYSSNGETEFPMPWCPVPKKAYFNFIRKS